MSELPKGTNLGPTVGGMAGGRTANTATLRSVYELAPADVQREMGKWRQDLQDDLDSTKWATDLDGFLNRTGLKALFNIPPWVLWVGGGLLVYAVARQIGIVPPIKKVISDG